MDYETSIVTFQKGQHPIEADSTVTAFYFLIYGIVRGYYIDSNGNEVTKCFSYENCFFGSECFRTNLPATFYVECLEECKCIKLPYHFVRKIMNIDFCKTYPNLQNRLPLKYVASYLGIAVGSLSRIRKDLKKRL